MKAHQLVALAFIGPPPFDGAEVCHKDGFHHNNHYSNLRWGTAQSNADDVARHRLDRRSISKLPRSRGEQVSGEAAAFICSSENHSRS